MLRIQKIYYLTPHEVRCSTLFANLKGNENWSVCLNVSTSYCKIILIVRSRQQIVAPRDVNFGLLTVNGIASKVKLKTFAMASTFVRVRVQIDTLRKILLPVLCQL